MSGLLDDDEIIQVSPDSIITSSIGSASLNYSVNGADDNKSIPPSSPQQNLLENDTLSPPPPLPTQTINTSSSPPPPTIITTTTTTTTTTAMSPVATTTTSSPTISASPTYITSPSGTRLSGGNTFNAQQLKSLLLASNIPIPPVPTSPTSTPPNLQTNNNNKQDKDKDNETFATLINEELPLTTEEKENIKAQKKDLISSLPEVPLFISPSPTLSRNNNGKRNSGGNKPPLSPIKISSTSAAGDVSPSISLNNSGSGIYNSTSPSGTASTQTLNILSQLQQQQRNGNNNNNNNNNNNYLSSPTMPALNKHSTHGNFHNSVAGYGNNNNNNNNNNKQPQHPMNGNHSPSNGTSGSLSMSGSGIDNGGNNNNNSNTHGSSSNQSSGVTSPIIQSTSPQPPHLTGLNSDSQMPLSSSPTMGYPRGNHNKKTSASAVSSQNRSPLMNSTGVSSSSSGVKQAGAGEKVMQFLGKMSLSKERMSKLVSQSKEQYKTPSSPYQQSTSSSISSGSGTISGHTSPNSLNSVQVVPFEGIFGIPLRVILRYPNESGNQIPSILNSIFTILESSSALSTNRLFYGDYNTSTSNLASSISPISTAANTTIPTISVPTSPNLSSSLSSSSSSGSSGNSSPNIINQLQQQQQPQPTTTTTTNTNTSPHQYLSQKSIKLEVENICNQYDQGIEVSLKKCNVHVVSEILIEFFNRLPEPIISVEFYETLLNYYQTETLLHLMIRKMNNPNKSILCRLMKYLKDIMVYTNFNDVTLELLVERFHKFILRPTIGTIAQSKEISESHLKTIKDIVTMFIQQADILFQSPEERMNTDDAQILYIEEVLTSTQKSQHQSSVGNLWLFHKQIVWRPKVNIDHGEPDLAILFSSILKIVLYTPPQSSSSSSSSSISNSSSASSSSSSTPSISSTSLSSSLKVLPNFTVYCSSDTKTVITFSFQSPSTCKLIYAYINSVTKSISQLNRIIPQKLDMFSLELESLPNEIKQLKDLQELNLNRNKFKLLPGDLARLTSLRTICIEENNLTEISSEMADFLGTRLSNLENVTLSSNRLVVLPPLYTWLKLKTLNISNNYLTKLPIDIFQIPTLEVLRVSNNDLDDNGIPKICTSTKLRSLDLRKNHLTSIPEGIINLVELQVLTLADNQISHLTSDIQKLTSLTELNLNGNQIQSLPPQLLLLTNLKKLYLDNNQLQSISSAIHRMQSLIELRLTNNNISRLPPGIVALKKLNSLELTGNKPLKDNIPEKYIQKGKEGIFSFFSETMRTNVPCYRTRIIMLGDKSTGKSNLIKCLKKLPKSSFSSSSSNLPSLNNLNSNNSNNSGNSKTNILDIQDWQCPINVDGPDGKKKKTITIHLWEFEGMQNDISHVFFVPNIIYTVCFNLSKFGSSKSNEQKITSYLHGINNYDKKATIIIIGTHLDEISSNSKKQVDKVFDCLSLKYKQLFPTLNLVFHAVSTLKSDADGIRKLRRDIKQMIAKNPILKQTYPASFMFLEDYLKEESNLMSPPLVTKKTLQQMARTMELHNEPHFTQLKSLFNSLGSIALFEQFIRMEPGSTPQKTEMIALNPIWIAKAIASLVCFNPQNLPFNVSVSAEEANDASHDSTITGILPHRVLRYVWGTNSKYYVPERFFSLFLSLLESNDLAINIYSLEVNNNNNNNSNGNNVGRGRSGSRSMSIHEANRSNSYFGVNLNNTSSLSSFTSNQKVRNGRSSSFNARVGWALVSSLLAPPPQLSINGNCSISSNSSSSSSSLSNALNLNNISSMIPIIDLPGIWEAFPESPEIHQFSRRFSLDVIPNGLFGRLLSRLMQHAHLYKCWKDLAILVPEIASMSTTSSSSSSSTANSTTTTSATTLQSLASGSSNNTLQQQFREERILVNVDHDSNTIEITIRFIRPSTLSSQVYSIFESLVSKWYKVSFKTFIPCSHCIEKKIVTPHLFKLEECEAQIFKGELGIYCQYKPNNNNSSNDTSSPIASSRSNPKISRKDSKNLIQSNNNDNNNSLSKKDLKELAKQNKEKEKEKEKDKDKEKEKERKVEIYRDDSFLVPIRSLLLDQFSICHFIKEIDYREIEVLPDHSNQNENGTSTQSMMGMYGKQFVNIKVFNAPLLGADFQNNCARILSSFRHEALSLYNFRHSNVLSIIGISMNPIAIITENPTFGSKGSTTLSEYIQDRQKHPEIPWNIKLKIALDIARAMDKLNSHSPPFLLTNLTSSGIILEKSNDHQSSGNGLEIEPFVNAKIIDFSQSSFLPSLFPTSTTPKSYHSPEVLQKLNYHENSDVYSFGIILYELLTRSIAFQDHDRFSNIVISGQRPSIPLDCLPSFADLIKDCWSGEPLNRPSPSKIISQLYTIKKEIESKEHSYKSLASDNNIYSDHPLPSGGSIIYQDKIIHFGGWNNSSKPHSKVFALNLSSMLFEDKLMVVLNNKQSTTYKAFYTHMQSEFNEENLMFYEAIKTFKSLPNQTPDDREIIKIQSKKIYQVFIGENAPKEINLPFLLKKELKNKIDFPDGPSVTVFNDTLTFVISSIEDSFHRFKFTVPTTNKNGWVEIECKGIPPLPMVGHSSILWNNSLIVIGGWFNKARLLNQIHILNLETFEWNQFVCTGDIPPSSIAALNITLHGDYLLAYYERTDSIKQQIFRLSLDSFIWFSLKLSNV
ncbi:Kelch repeat-containing protein [Dictyostelium discoideum AX4]|uniref:Probable inactive serine/threonine-protein kinase roco10 n=1 Tax=Dictyostelium discoideum TaxID=44689 RepID=ROC10_DICDI|nr:Kelch repeat-containing protein [Dictyostelium discoideum AX4]Q6XHA6.1 RecName: Full=Probable inactive serine/threonine-protein kinase roco10; AltName: Full=Ras of complex proteins and C-terminal of roc 10 [Dictyostelium discoideum]AAO83655.1 putative protein Roco10 [Dictyostelium discoideum]EAL61591.1 Kelch repeat-containing protein [Dictyostelium discoideum AX4]|eukprot:XP_630003.1 Kelch repeat-containing protein [Dictyostelium discoideum AX4]